LPLAEGDLYDFGFKQVLDFEIVSLSDLEMELSDWTWISKNLNAFTSYKAS